MKRSVLVLSFAGALACARHLPVPGPPEAVRVLSTAVISEREVRDATEIDGEVIGKFDSVLSSRLAARVLDVAAVPGREVRAGEVLVRLEHREAEEALAGAREGRAAAEVSFEIAQRNRERYARLEERGSAALVELERAVREESMARAQVAAARATVRRAETDRSQAVLTAPFDAVVVEKMVSPGDLATPGRPLVRIASRAGRRVEAAPGEEQAARLSVGDRVEVVLGETVVSGRVAEVVASVDSLTRRRIVRVDLPAGVEPPVGSFARVRLPGILERRIVAPLRAVRNEGGLWLVWALGADGRTQLRYVRTGARIDSESVEIRSGVSAGERVVLDPPADLVAGTRVRP